MEFYDKVIKLTGSDAHTMLGTLAIRVLRLVGSGAEVDMETIKWASYIVTDCCGHPCSPDYLGKFQALEQGVRA